MVFLYALHVTILLSFFSCVLAVPSLAPSLTSTNLFLPHNVSSSVLTAFPPGRSPGPYYEYIIPHTSPVIEVLFKRFQYKPTRAESEVDAVLRAAIEDTGRPEISNDVVPIRPWSWTENFTRLEFRLARTRAVARLRMTWGQFNHALEAADAFRRAYPGLDFSWELRVHFDGFIYWGEGYLWNLRP